MKWQDRVLIDFSKNRQLQTERLQLRPMTIEDLTDYHEYTSDEEVLKFDYFPHKNLAESELSLVKWNLSQPLGRYGVELLSEGKLIGNASLRPTQERVDMSVSLLPFFLFLRFKPLCFRHLTLKMS